MKLFIIGNGFDLNHDLPTSYNDFREYLATNYTIDEVANQIPPEGTLNGDGEIVFDNNHIAGFITNIISDVEGSLWQDLENSLGIIDYSALFDHLPKFEDKEGDPDHRKHYINNEDNSLNLLEVIPKIQILFQQWLRTININIEKNKNFESLINDDDYFLNFNYTKTLQEIYHVNTDKICHIHGEVNKKIYFGHGNNDSVDEEISINHFGAESNIQKIHEKLRKNTKEALENNSNFFNNLDNNITKIYSFGFSYSSIDKIYIEQICNRINTKNATWYFHDHDKKKLKQYRSFVKNCGYLGKYNIFST